MPETNILVTGASGLVGTHLLYLLTSEGFKVKALVRSKESISKVRKTFGYYSPDMESLIAKIDWIEGDVEDYHFLAEALEGIKYVYHSAAAVSFSPFEKEKIFKTNIKGTANVVNACLINHVEKLCYVSSVASLGHTEDGSPVTEQTKWVPSEHVSVYSLSKFHAETEVWRGIEEGLRAVIVNPSVILGPGDWTKGSSSIISSIYKGLKYHTAGNTGYIDVRDVCKIMILLMNSPVTNERFLLNSENYSFKDAFTAMTLALGIKRKMKEAKPWMMQIAWRWEYLKYYLFRIQPRITKDVIRSGKRQNLYSSKKITDTLSYKFIPVQDSIRHLAQCYLKDH